MGNNAKNQSFIQNYDNIRDIVRFLYLYGCFDENELEEYNIIKKSSYQQYKKKLTSYIDGDHIKSSTHTKDNGEKSKKTLSIIHEMHEDEYNYFCNTYAMKNLVLGKFRSYILYLQCLSNSESGYGLSELNQKTSALLNLDTKYQIERLKELCDLGLVETSIINNKTRYKIKENILSNKLFETDDFALRFLDFVSLLRNKIQPYVCGNMLLETALTFFECSESPREFASNYSSPFFIRDGHFEQVLDDNIVYFLINAMHSGNKVMFNYCSDNYNNIIPLKIVTNAESGLRYLFALVTDSNRYEFFHLEEISKLKTNEKEKDFIYEEHKNDYSERTRYSFSGVTCLNDGEKPLEILLKVRRTSKNEFLKKMNKLFTEIETERTDGENFYISKVKVNTLDELLPWLRRNMANVQLIDNNILNNELAEWRELYGVI